jgi:beta-galactosidase
MFTEEMLSDPSATLNQRRSVTDGSQVKAAAITIDSFSVLKDGRPWFPVMGEYHFSRDLPSRWRHELQKIKAGGIDVVATYLIWIIHEENEGNRRWDGARNVRRFVETAKDVGLTVMLRVGPWAHGEARNGGFPDWLQQLPVHHRTNDPRYLELVEDWYSDIARQLSGLFRDDQHPDAPIVAIQVDNELYDQPEHLGHLRDVAEKAGMAAPLWVATGWGGAQLPLDRLIPVYAGYSDGFWEESDVQWPPYAKMHFEFSEVRDDLSVGADLRGRAATIGVDDHRYPFITCELGAGMATAYHRRPLVDPDDVAALALTKIGSGSSWQGYYLYHGTTQVTGELSGTQESHATGYPNDMPQKDYDFYAPIGASGTLRLHYHLLRRQHLFLRAWGGELTLLPITFPKKGDQNLRWSLRADEQGGYLFVNNHQPAVHPLPACSEAKFDFVLGSRKFSLPSEPVTVPSQSYFLWPISRKYGEAVLTGTVQPITQIESEEGLLAIFSATPGIDVELDIEAGAHIIMGAAEIETAAGKRWIPEVRPGPDCIITVGTTRLVILDDVMANTVYVGTVNGQDIIVIWDGGLTFEAEGILLERWSTATDLLSYPALSGGAKQVGPFTKSVLGARPSSAQPSVVSISAASEAPPTRTGGSVGRLSAPTNEDFASAAVFEVNIPALDPEQATVLSISWTGDVLRAYFGEELIADQFWNGRPVEIDIAPWRGSAQDTPAAAGNFAVEWRSPLLHRPPGPEIAR